MDDMLFILYLFAFGFAVYGLVLIIHYVQLKKYGTKTTATLTDIFRWRFRRGRGWYAEVTWIDQAGQQRTRTIRSNSLRKKVDLDKAEICYYKCRVMLANDWRPLVWGALSLLFGIALAIFAAII